MTRKIEIGNHKATINRCAGTDEFIVSLWENGKKIIGADYFTDDKEDAQLTARDMVTRASARA